MDDRGKARFFDINVGQRRGEREKDIETVIGKGAVDSKIEIANVIWTNPRE